MSTAIAFRHRPSLSPRHSPSVSYSTLSTDLPQPAWSAPLCARLFWGWMVARTLFWTALMTLTQPNAPLDLVEWLSWGHEWRWGYHKHPPLSAWLAEAFSYLTPGSMTGVYLGSYLITALGPWAVWRLGRTMLAPHRALLAALSLDGLIFFTYDAAQFSNNVVLNGCWALVVLCAHRAFRTGLLRWWLALGLVVGLALLTKYTVAILLVCLVAFAVCHPEARPCWRRAGPYLAILVAALVFAPHAVWMVRTQFMTIHYAVERSADTHWLNHVKNPLFFALSQLGRLLPLFFILLPLTTRHWRWRTPSDHERFDRAFLLTAVLGPVWVHWLLSCSFGLQLREIWGFPLWTFLGLLVLACLRLDDRPATSRQALTHWGVVVLLFLAYTFHRNYLDPYLRGHPTRIHFPGQQLAEEVSRLWREQYPRPFSLVAGDCWLAGNIGIYAQPRPSVYFSPGLYLFELDPRIVPWTSDEDVARRGGVVVWNADQYGEELPTLLRNHFPTAETQPHLLLPYTCGAQLKPVHVGLAFVPPEELTTEAQRARRAERDKQFEMQAKQLQDNFLSLLLRLSLSSL
jgi:4-amino-4-deoxy-L-arabinose transferase-like glycosyltransferase